MQSIEKIKIQPTHAKVTWMVKRGRSEWLDLLHLE